jgi:hypothetical protein
VGRATDAVGAVWQRLLAQTGYDSDVFAAAHMSARGTSRTSHSTIPRNKVASPSIAAFLSFA